MSRAPSRSTLCIAPIGLFEAKRQTELINISLILLSYAKIRASLPHSGVDQKGYSIYKTVQGIR